MVVLQSVGTLSNALVVDHLVGFLRKCELGGISTLFEVKTVVWTEESVIPQSILLVKGFLRRINATHLVILKSKISSTVTIDLAETRGANLV